MMLIDKLLAIASAEIGTKESPANSNNVKYNTWYYGRAVSGSNFAWCGAFIAWCFFMAGLATLFLTKAQNPAYCPNIVAIAKKLGQWVTSGYQKGDVVLYNFSGGTSASHVGLIESVTATTITAIEGNTGSGNDANGGAVMRRVRDKKYIIGAFRPNYDGAAIVKESLTAPATTVTQSAVLPTIRKGDKGETVKMLQTALNSKYGYNLTVDGDFGTKTDAAVRNLQKSYGLTVDGIVGKNTWGKLGV
jgi:hypothetical protein